MIVIVVGMHRSGTSALAGFLHKNSIKMGRQIDFYPKPSKDENPKGFFENVRFRTLNDQWLQQGWPALEEYNVKQWERDPVDISKGSRVDGARRRPDIFNVLQAQRLIDFYDLVWTHWKDRTKVGDWGFKDPRTCLTLAWWLEVLKVHEPRREVRVLIMNRSSAAIGRSMEARGNCSAARGLVLAEQYMAIAMAQLSLFPKVPRLWIEFKNLVERPGQTAVLLSDFLGRDIKHEGTGRFIDRNLKHWEEEA